MTQLSQLYRKSFGWTAVPTKLSKRLLMRPHGGKVCSTLWRKRQKKHSKKPQPTLNRNRHLRLLHKSISTVCSLQRYYSPCNQKLHWGWEEYRILYGSRESQYICKCINVPYTVHKYTREKKCCIPCPLLKYSFSKLLKIGPMGAYFLY